MHEEEKVLRMKLLKTLEIIKKWPAEWDPEQPGLSKFSRGFYKAFHSKLLKDIEALEKTLDDVRWTQVS